MSEWCLAWCKFYVAGRWPSRYLVIRPIRSAGPPGVGSSCPLAPIISLSTSNTVISAYAVPPKLPVMRDKKHLLKLAMPHLSRPEIRFIYLLNLFFVDPPCSLEPRRLKILGLELYSLPVVFETASVLFEPRVECDTSIHPSTLCLSR